MYARKPKFRIPAWAFILFIAVYDELLLHFWISSSFVTARFLCVLLFAVSFGLILGFFSALGKNAVFSRVVALLFSAVLLVLYITEYLVNDAFKTFMTLRSIFFGAGDVAGDFGGTVVTLVFQEFWRILVLAAPIVLYAILAGKKHWGKARSPAVPIVLLLASVVLFFVSVLCVKWFSPDSEKYNKQYNFTNAVYSFGLTTALRLDLSHNTQSNPVDNFDLPAVTTADGTDATVSTTQAPVVYGFNKMDFDFATLAEQSDVADIAAVHEYVASLQPSRQNEYTGLFKGKNLIFITAESFSAEAIDKDLTPTLYRMANQGIKFTDYYQPAWGGSTSSGEYSNMTGLIPTDGVDSLIDTKDSNMYLALGNQFLRLGYTSYAYHNNTYDYYDRDITHPNLGYTTYMGLGNGMEAGVKEVWPESDLEMIDFTAPLYISKQPFNVYYMSVSGHCTYSRVGNSMSVKNYEAVENENCSETVKCYYAANLELEYAMKSLVQHLTTAGILDDTVIVIGADHYPYGLEESATWGNYEDYLTELYGYEATDCFKRDHNALIIWSSSIEGMNLQIDTPVYSPDIVPTLSNLFGLEYDSRLLVGRDVFSDEMPLAIWMDYSWKTDKGSYNAQAGTFTPADGVTVSDDYVSTVHSIVKNKMSFSRAVLNNDYYTAVFGKK